MARTDLIKLRINADRKLASGDTKAQTVIDAINNASPTDSYILFMGFCPGGEVKNRLDLSWKGKGICRFDYFESKQQVERFNTICTGDLVVLKKTETFGKTMGLYGHWRVISISYDAGSIRYLNVDWADQSEVIVTPLMGCTSTVDIKLIEVVEDYMPEEFYDWLGTNNPASNKAR